MNSSGQTGFHRGGLPCLQAIHHIPKDTPCTEHNQTVNCGTNGHCLVGQDGASGTLEIGFQGAEVNVRRRRLLPDAEPKIGETLTRYVHNEGITVTCGVAYGDIGRSETGVALSMQIDGVSHTVKAEQVLVCTGRRPNTQGLVLADAGL